MENITALRIVRRPEVLHLTGLSRATLYRLIAEDMFPRPVRLTAGHAVGWRQSDLQQWLENLEPVSTQVDRTSAEFEVGSAS